MIPRDQTRAKYIAVITMARTAAALGEPPALTAIARMCGVSNAFPTRLRAAGLMEEQANKLVFTAAAAKMTVDEIIDKLIEWERPKEEAPTGHDADTTRLQARVDRLEREMRDLFILLEQEATGLHLKIAALTENKKTNGEQLLLVAPATTAAKTETPPAAIVPPSPPKPRVLRGIVVGPYGDQFKHIADKVRNEGLPVELHHADADHPKDTAKFDFAITTSQVPGRWVDILRIAQTPRFHTDGGISGAVIQIRTAVLKLKTP